MTDTRPPWVRYAMIRRAFLRGYTDNDTTLIRLITALFTEAGLPVPTELLPRRTS